MGETIVRLLSTLLLLLILLSSAPTWAQSRWKPINPGGGGIDIPKFDPRIHEPRIDTDRYSDSKAKRVSAKRDSVVTEALKTHRPEASTAWTNVLPWRPLPPETLQAIADETGLEPARLEVHLESALPRRRSISATTLFSRPGLGDLNDIFLAQELNGTDGRNHGDVTWLSGFSIDYRHRLDRRWGVRGHYGLGQAVSKDRETWVYAEVEDGPTMVTRDEQKVELTSQTFGVDVFLDGSLRQLMWSLFLGAQIQVAKLRVAYVFDADDQYNYDVESDLAAGAGLRTGITFHTPVLGGLGMRTEAGYLAAKMSSLNIDGQPWYWQDLDGNQVRAKLQTGGVFASVGLEYFF